MKTVSSGSDLVEDHSRQTTTAESKEGVQLKLDKYGVPLSPQPSDDPEDPCMFFLN